MLVRKCSFCGESEHSVRNLVAGKQGFICNECIDNCVAMLQSQQEIAVRICSFCGKSEHNVKNLIAGRQVLICNECIYNCVELLNPPHDLLHNGSSISGIMEIIDTMNGYEFEKYVGSLFSKLGYDVMQTSFSGDQGVDIVAKRKGAIIAIQTKRYSQKVGNSAIQEVVAGANYHKCKQKLIVTNNYFTKSAYDLALANEVVLWDRDKLIEEITNLYHKTNHGFS